MQHSLASEHETLAVLQLSEIDSVVCAQRIVLFRRLQVGSLESINIMQHKTKNSDPRRLVTEEDDVINTNQEAIIYIQHRADLSDAHFTHAATEFIF